MTIWVHGLPNAERSFVLEVPGTYLIGTGDEASVCLPPESNAAPRHAVLTLQAGSWQIQDLKSPGGTFLNGQKIDQSQFTRGAEIRCGRILLIVDTGNVDPESPTVTQWAPRSRDPAAEETAVVVVPSIKGYTDLQLIGVGGLGTVFQACQLDTGRTVAIKCIRPELEGDERTRQMFLREAAITAQLKHPRIVEHLGFGLAENRPYLVMEYIPAENLEKIVLQHGPQRRIRLAVKIVLQLLEALEFAHAQGIVHRDVKPSNILATTTSGRLHLKVSDFGLGKVFQTAGHSGITASTDIRGTLIYMSPEQLIKSRDAKPDSDVYSAVVCLYRLLTGEFPQPVGPAADVIYRRLNEPAVPVQTFNPDIPDDLARIIDLGLSRSLEMRFATAASLRAALNQTACLQRSSR